MRYTTLITAEDVLQIAMNLNIVISDNEINEVLERYEEAQENDKSATWDLVVENLIYQLD